MNLDTFAGHDRHPMHRQHRACAVAARSAASRPATPSANATLLPCMDPPRGRAIADDLRGILAQVIHLIASHQGRPSDDPIFALNAEASKRKAAGEAVV